MKTGGAPQKYCVFPNYCCWACKLTLKRQSSFEKLAALERWLFWENVDFLLTLRWYLLPWKHIPAIKSTNECLDILTIVWPCPNGLICVEMWFGRKTAWKLKFSWTTDWTTVGQNINLLRNQPLNWAKSPPQRIRFCVKLGHILFPRLIYVRILWEWEMPKSLLFHRAGEQSSVFELFHCSLEFASIENAVHNVRLFAQLGNSGLTTRQQMILWKLRQKKYPLPKSPIRKGVLTKYITLFWHHLGKLRGPAQNSFRIFGP